MQKSRSELVSNLGKLKLSWMEGCGVWNTLGCIAGQCKALSGTHC